MRVIVERLARRCGYDAVAGAIPESDRKLLVHIRKERTKKESRKHDDSASQVSPLPLYLTPHWMLRRLQTCTYLRTYTQLS